MAMRVKNLRKYTQGEILWLTRRSKNLTQTEAAREYDVTFKQYLSAEKDRVPLPSSLVKAWHAYPTGVVCALARRRHGLSLLKTATLLGVSHVTLLRMERDNDPNLIVKWKRLKYQF